MFIGHFAPAIAAATHKEAPSLPVLMIAAQLIDWAFFGLLLFGVEKLRFTPGISVMNPMDLYHMPYTHSLVGAIAFGVGAAVIVWAFTRRWMAAVITGAVVVSHWFLDLLVHVPDLTLAGSPPKLGLGLWNHPMIEMPLEFAITFGALWYWAKSTGRRGAGLWVLTGLMLALQLFNWFGPVDAEVTAMTSYMALFAYGLVTLASWWAERGPAVPQESRLGV